MGRRLPPLNAVRAFEAAARHLSFTRAADELNVTQAAISHQVKGLEEWLGLPLFRRMNRALVLTEAGQAYLPTIRDALDRIAAATDKLARRDATGTLTVSVLPSLAARWLVLRLGRFQAAHPELETRLTASQELADFARQDVDVAIRFGRGPWPGLQAVRLMSEEVFPVCSPRLLEKGPPIRTPDDLRHHVLLRDDHPVQWSAWLRTAGVEQVEPKGPFFSDSSILIQAALDGQGVALTRNVLVTGELAAGRLVRLFDLSISDNSAYWIVAPPHYFTRPKVAAFRDWLLAEAENMNEGQAAGG